MDYIGLKDLVEKALTEQQDKKAEGKKTGSNELSKHRSAITIWVKTLGLSEQTRVIDQLKPDAFQTALDTFHKRLQESGASVNTIGPLKTQIRFAQKQYLAKATSKQWLLAKNFPMALQVLMKEHGYRNSIDLSRASGIPSGTIRRWLRGANKLQRHKHLQLLERVFSNLGPGELAAVLPAGIANGRSEKDRVQRKRERLLLSKYRHRRQALSQVAYAADLDALPFVKQELQQLYKFKTSQANLTTMVREGIWKASKDEGCPTYEKFRKEISVYFGFLTNPSDHEDLNRRGLGMDPATVSLAHLSDVNAVKAFLDFLSFRAGLSDPEHPEHNRYPAFAKMFLKTCKTQLRPDKGYIFQNYPLFGSKLGTAIQNEADWQSHCTRAFKLFGDFKKDFKFHKGRKEEKAANDLLYSILEAQNPIQELLDIKAALKEETQKVTTDPVRCARAWRDLAMISLVSLFPLRPRTLGNLRIGSNIFKRDGRYYLALTTDELKNWYSDAAKDIEVCLDDPDGDSVENSEIFDEYLLRQRPKLAAAKGSYVFIPAFPREEGAQKEMCQG